MIYSVLRKSDTNSYAHCTKPFDDLLSNSVCKSRVIRFSQTFSNYSLVKAMMISIWWNIRLRDPIASNNRDSALLPPFWQNQSPESFGPGPRLHKNVKT